MIVKLQLPVVFGTMALVYNEDRSFMMELPLEDGVIRKALGDRYKAFFQAEYDEGTRRFTLGEEAPWAEW